MTNPGPSWWVMRLAYRGKAAVLTPPFACGEPMFRWEFWLLAESRKVCQGPLTSLFPSPSLDLENNKFDDDIVPMSYGT